MLTVVLQDLMPHATWIRENVKQGLSWGSQVPEVHNSTEILISKRNDNEWPLGVLQLTMTRSNINKQFCMHHNEGTFSKRLFLFFLYIYFFCNVSC